MFEGLFQNPQGNTESSPNQSGIFSSLFKSSSASTTPTSSPSFFTGKGYGVSAQTDLYSNRPLLTVPEIIPPTYNTPKQTVSVEDPRRVATTFDPTKPQRLTSDMLTNGRMSDSVSAPIKAHLGGAYSDELDHQIALELSGSNQPENLKVVPGRVGGTAAMQDTLENQLARKVKNGEISLVDAQLQLASAKGFKLPESKPSFLERIQNAALLLPPSILDSLASFQEFIEGIPAGIKDFAERTISESAPARVIGEIQAGKNPLTAFLDVYNERPLPQQVQIAIERNINYKRAITQGKNQDEARRLAVNTMTPTEIANVQNLTMGFISPEGELGLAKAIATSNSVEDIAIMLRKAGVAEDLIPSYSQKLAGISSEKEVASVLKNAGMIQTTTKAETIPGNFMASPESATAFETARKEMTINVDTAAQDQALADTVAGNLNKKGVGGFAPELKGAFEDWVNERRTSGFQGLVTKNAFKDLNNQGIEGIFKVQTGENTGRFKDVRDFFDKKYTQLVKAGVNLGYKSNYMPQIWNNTPSEIMGAFGKRLGLRPSFTMESVIADYKEGIAQGLTPKYGNISDLTSWYEQRANKLLADKKFFDFLGKNSLIQPTSRAPLGWKAIDPKVFPVRKAFFNGKEYTGTFSAPPDLQEAIENYLKNSDGALKEIAKFSTLTKNIVLSTGMPGTGYNFHSFNVAVRTMLSAENPITSTAKALYWMARPGEAEKFLMDNSERASYFSSKGLTLTSEDHVLENVGNKITGLMEKERNYLKKWFSDPLFKKVIPAVKVNLAENITKYLVEHGYTEDAAAKIASRQANDFIGGLNLDQIGRNKQTQDLIRSLVFAPDFQETNLNIGIGMVKSLKNFSSPEGHAYRIFARNLLMSYIGANVVNAMTTGRPMFLNDSGHKFDIAIGRDTNGKFRYLRPFGTAADFARLPVDAAIAIGKGDMNTLSNLLRNRITVPLGQLVTFATGQDAYGNKIFDPTKSTQETAMGFVRSLAGIVAPQAVQAGVDYLRGKIDGEQAISQSLGLPLRYAKNTESDMTIAQMIYTERPSWEKQIKDLESKGDSAGAFKIMSDFNRKLIDNTRQSYLRRGLPVPPLAKIIKSLHIYFLKPPKQKTIQKYRATKGQSLFSKLFK